KQSNSSHEHSPAIVCGDYPPMIAHLPKPVNPIQADSVSPNPPMVGKTVGWLAVLFWPLLRRGLSAARSFPATCAAGGRRQRSHAPPPETLPRWLSTAC